MEIQEIMQVLTIFAVVIMFYWQYRSFPPNETAKLLDQLTDMASKTESRLDDAIIDIMEYVNNARANSEDQDMTSPGA